MNFAYDGDRTDCSFVSAFTQMIMPAKSRNRHPNFLLLDDGRRTKPRRKNRHDATTIVVSASASSAQIQQTSEEETIQRGRRLHSLFTSQ